MMAVRAMVLAAGVCGAVLVAGCGIITAPVSVAKAVATNANFAFAGDVVDESGNRLNGVIISRVNSHRFWTPIMGGTDKIDTITRRADGTFRFEDRGERLTFTFTRDGYQDAEFVLDAEDDKFVRTSLGKWPLGKHFNAVMFSAKGRDAELEKFNDSISYADYPMAASIALPNVATGGQTGDVKYYGKDAEDATVYPAGTLYLTMSKEPPAATNSRGDVDPKDLEIPHHVTLHLPGKGSGFLRMDPRVGFHPIAASSQAPEGDYRHELTIDRERLKAMRLAAEDDILGAREYFFFRAGKRYGKGAIGWASREGKVSFRYELYVQPREEDRNLRTHGLAK
jgi:hypothetical protein